jgi:sulfate transport system ATP-binding protein
MTVFENIAFGLRVRPRPSRPSEEKIRARVLELLSLLHIEGLEHRYPAQLSGGQRQRVALARALAVEPSVLLLDEPFGALDAKVRRELRRWIRRLHDEIHITNVFVTHDQEEAIEVSDRVAVLNNGHIEQIGTPTEVYHHPSNSFVYDFLGNYNEIDGCKDEQGSIYLIEGKKDSPTGKPVKVFARPHEMTLALTPTPGQTVSAQVVHINLAGSLVKLELERPDGSLLEVEVTQEVVQQLQIKTKDYVYVGAKTTRVFD